MGCHCHHVLGLPAPSQSRNQHHSLYWEIHPAFTPKTQLKTPVLAIKPDGPELCSPERTARRHQRDEEGNTENINQDFSRELWAVKHPRHRLPSQLTHRYLCLLSTCHSSPPHPPRYLCLLSTRHASPPHPPHPPRAKEGLPWFPQRESGVLR